MFAVLGSLGSHGAPPRFAQLRSSKWLLLRFASCPSNALTWCWPPPIVREYVSVLLQDVLGCDVRVEWGVVAEPTGAALARCGVVLSRGQAPLGERCVHAPAPRLQSFIRRGSRLMEVIEGRVVIERAHVRTRFSV